MPRVPFDSLPGSARVWIFASDRELSEPENRRLLTLADEFLDQWAAHGKPLRCARDWRDHRFLTLGVDPTHEQASGCSIDGMFRALQTFQRDVGAQLLGGARVFYRDQSGAVRVDSRDEFERLASTGAVAPDTVIFDTSLTKASDYRARFEVPARDAWTAWLFPAAQPSSKDESRAATQSSSASSG